MKKHTLYDSHIIAVVPAQHLLAGTVTVSCRVHVKMNGASLLPASVTKVKPEYCGNGRCRRAHPVMSLQTIILLI